MSVLIQTLGALGAERTGDAAPSCVNNLNKSGLAMHQTLTA